MRYYLEDEGETIGPLELDELRARMADSSPSHRARVREDWSNQWQRAADHPDCSDLVQQPPHKLPSLPVSWNTVLTLLLALLVVWLLATRGNSGLETKVRDLEAEIKHLESRVRRLERD